MKKAIEPKQGEGEAGIKRVGHRTYVGGMWNEIGKLQFDFLVDQGLQRSDCFLDIACGSLRGGVHFIQYLDAGNYLGIDKESKLIELGVQNELGKEMADIKKPQFVVSDTFEFHDFTKKPQYSLAHSLFTHLNSEDVSLCLANLRNFVEPGHILFATFRDRWSGGVLAGITSANLRKSESHTSFKYSKRDMTTMGKRHEWKATYIGNWKHPRNQVMMNYEAI